jgi:hypothetical protein
VYRTFLPTATLLTGGDNGKLTNDRVTSNTALTFSGTAPPGSYVGLFISGTSVQLTATQLPPGVTSYNLNHTATLNAQTTYNIRVKSSASAGAWSWAPSTTVWVDSLATFDPTTQSSTTPTMTAATDTGLSQTDGITTNTTPAFFGAMPASGVISGVTRVNLVENASNRGEAIWTSGNYNVNATVLSIASHDMTAIFRNVATAPIASYFTSSPRNIFIDTTAVPSPSLVDCQPGGPARTGSTSNGSTSITNLSLTSDNLAPGMTVSGAGIPGGTTIISVDSKTKITISQMASATASGVALTFGACSIPEVLVIKFNKPVSWPSALNLGDLTMIRNDAGTIVSIAGTTHFTADSSFSPVDDYYTGKTMRFTSGIVDGETRQVMDYIGATRTFVLTGSGATVGTTFQIDSLTETGSVASVVSHTQFNGNSAFSTINDYYVGRRVRFTSGVLNGQTSRVLDYIGSTRTFIFQDFQPDTFTTAPAVNDTFTMDVNRIPSSLTATLEPGYDSSQWLLKNIKDLTMSSGRYTLALNAGNNVRSLSWNVGPATVVVPAAWTQTDGAYQNGGKTEGPGGTPGVYLDVDADGYIAPIDALIIANLLNAVGPQNLATYCGSGCNPPYYDANNDGWVTSTDFDTIINWLNAGGHSAPPAFAAIVGEGSPAADLQATDVTANVQLVTTDLTGTPITSVKVGQQFQLRAFLVLAAPEGVQPVAGYADVQFSPLLVTPVASSADVGFTPASSVSAGLIDEAGQLMYGDASGLMFVKTLKATKKGTATFNANAADLFGHEIHVSGLTGPLPWSQITFGSTTLTIKP